jgi:L-lactate dehydrogenase complex protein LldG
MAPLQGWRFLQVGSPAEAADAVAAVAQRLGARLAVRSDHPVFQRVPLDSALRARGVQSLGAAPAASDGSLRKAVWTAELGVTGLDYLVAETATAVLLSGHGLSRLASLLPPVHVVVAEAGQVVGSLEELLALLSEGRRGAFLEGGALGSAMTFISGPSRTADIEQTLVVGAHGPKEAHLLLMGENTP